MSKPTSSVDPKTGAGKARLTLAQVKHIAGQMEDIRAAEIVATGATVEDLEEAVAWAAGESDVMGDARLRASPTVAEIYELLTADVERDEYD